MMERSIEAGDVMSVGQRVLESLDQRDLLREMLRIERDKPSQFTQ